MSRTNLTDTFVIDGVRKTEDGYLTAFAKVARTGVQTYRGSELGRPDLAQVRVYRPPEEVFAPDAMHSFAHKPLTLRHPPRAVNAKSWKQYSGGHTGDEVVRDGEFIRVPMVMMDAGLVDAYERRGIDQLSMGYSTELRWESGVVPVGVTDAGETYDAVQTNIRANHLALVPIARGGDQLRVGDDAGTCPKCGAEMRGDKCPECNYTKDGELQMKTFTLDGFSVSVADDQSQSIIQKIFDGLGVKLRDAQEDLEKFKKKEKETQDALDESKKLVSAKDGEIAVLNQKIKDAEVTPAKLDVMVKDRMSVIDRAVAILGKDFAFDGKTIADIRKAAVVAKLGDAAAQMDDAAIGGAFAALVADGSGRNGTQPIADAFAARRPGYGGVSVTEATKAYDEMCKGLESAYKGPTAAAS